MPELEDDPYTAFCFDEACAFIITKLEQKEEPLFDDGPAKKKVFKSFSELYGSLNLADEGGQPNVR